MWWKNADMEKAALVCTFFYIVINQCYIVEAEPKGNIFTAIAHMEPLVGIEIRLVEIAREKFYHEHIKK